ncbi:MAG TPA: hypothetical protein VK171_07625 [Fimbriimonas sp.]|nr:hypothetical protein [Fimbriimonas sp.]
MIFGFVSFFLASAAFVAGTWFLIRAIGSAYQKESVNSAFFLVVGLGLKFPAVILVLKFAKSSDQAQKNGAIAAVVLVYFLSVVGASIYGLRQNKSNK